MRLEIVQKKGGLLAGDKVYVAIAGNIGVGKTTLTRLLSEYFGWEPYFEPVANNPYLTDFYQNMGRWCFPLQVYFLNHRFKSHQEVTQTRKSAVQDRSIYEDANIFARNLYEQGCMEKRDYHTYLDLYEMMCQYLTPPDLIIYLRKSLPTVKSRIAQRGREFERSISDEYLTHLGRYYDDWMETYQLGKKLIVESDRLDFLEKPSDFQYLVGLIMETVDQPDLFFSQRKEMENRAKLLI